MKRMFVVGVLMAAALPLQARSRAVIKPVVIYSMEHCPACEALAAALSDAGTRMRVSQTASVTVDAFPTVVYSDGRRDSGARIQSGACELPGTIRVVKWSGE
jgi:hypothetical protein